MAINEEIAPVDVVRDAAFLLDHVLDIDAKPWLPRMLPAEIRTLMLEQAQALFGEVVAPLRRLGDTAGARFANGAVAAPAGFREAYRAITEAGLHASTISEDEGGVGLSSLVSQFVDEMAGGANQALAMYYGFNAPAARTVRRFGETWLADIVVPHLVTGDWTATMVLTEPQAGSDLAQVRTRATANEDGSYAITGTKIFISAGDHDITENIVHVVLARTEDGSGPARPGLPGLGVFIVPKFDLMTGEPNGVETIGIEHKMGLHGNPTCSLQFSRSKGFRLAAGAAGGAAGMAAMFDMMNHARLGTATGSLGAAAAAAAAAFAYANERRSGHAAGSNGQQPDPIIHHPDVQRMVLSSVAFVEGARAMLAWTSLMIETAASHPEPERRGEAGAMAHLLTPILKAFVTDQAWQVCDDAIQVHGGHGYVSDTGIEQYARDLRVARIYEGANGIQAYDLVMRRMPAGGGLGLKLLRAAIHETIDSLRDDRRLGALDAMLARGMDELDATLEAAERYRAERPDLLLGCATSIVELFGLVLVGWRSLVSASVAAETAPEMFAHKQKLAEHWLSRHLPAAVGLRTRLEWAAMQVPA